ncbi:hypothetical protein ACQPZF_26945 [Actinosynnema sp. CS-041913]|uniref:hypothetical protein n=1 Tax=Actinosynnema sp. CS-041913 TaxID=3239917 RepID=UPI003D8D3B2B
MERFHQAFRAIAALGTDDRVVHGIARFLVEVSNRIENEINSEDGQSSGPAYAAEVLGGATQAQTPAMRLILDITALAVQWDMSPDKADVLWSQMVGAADDGQREGMMAHRTM